ncbi:uncharacterized protein LOC114542579 [Dendronephthya gigantea]|uniref:uncharacterized protein LOC114542579 n=1 Tax=Dendronephthya gigantea TaxID=151771 RepID=UPI00106B70F4|nr:uncharacterized protein LOC114542579 [Dendronephthya gigantea]
MAATLGIQSDISTVELIQMLQAESEQCFKRMEALSSYSCSDNELQNELERLQGITKQLNQSLESSGLSALPGDLDLMQDSQAFIKKAREETDNSRSTLKRIQANCKTLLQAMVKK